MGDGDLNKYPGNHGQLPEHMAQEVLRQSFLGIKYIHGMWITHRDPGTLTGFTLEACSRIGYEIHMIYYDCLISFVLSLQSCTAVLFFPVSTWQVFNKAGLSLVFPLVCFLLFGILKCKDGWEYCQWRFSKGIKSHCDCWYWYGNGDVNDSRVWNGRMAGISGPLERRLA